MPQNNSFTLKSAIAIILITLLMLTSSIAQDIDIYAKSKNDNYQFPSMNSKMTFDEFQLLNKSLKMQDMLYAMLVPGYVHFKAKDKRMGYSLLSLRSIGFAGILYVSNETGVSLPALLEFSGIGGDLYKTERNLLLTSSVLILGTYFFDWIHGKYRLEKKQEMIRYRYGLKMSFSSISMRHSDKLFLGFTLQYKL